MASPPPSSPPGPPAKRPDLFAPMRTVRFWVILAILFLANVIVSNLAFSAGQPPTVTISYNTFLDQVDAGNVVTITSTGDTITGTTKTAVKDSSGTTSTKFQTERPTFANDDLETALDAVLERGATDGHVTVRLRLEAGTICAAVGPLPVESLRPELERDPGGDVTLRRILDTVVDGYELGGDGWLELTKHVEQESDS